MSEVLHESTGLRIVRNDNNKMAVCTLHYTADPLKRSKEWKAEAKTGMNEARWQKEYEINYVALYGQRVFPEIASNKLRIVVDEPYKEYGPLQPFWGGFDFGQRNPSAFYVFTIDDGVIYAVWELYETEAEYKTLEGLANKIMTCPYYHQIKFIACDPTIIQQKSRTNKYGQFCPLGELFMDYGLKKLVPGNTDETAWLGMMRHHWANAEDPTFKIRSCCPNMIAEFENAVFAGQSDREVLTQTYKEKIEDVHNHAMDATKYFMNSRPTSRPRSWQDPQQWRRWVK